MSKAKILVVEDEPLISDDIESYLEDLGYKVSAVVDNANDAIASIKKDKPDLAILDIKIEGSIDGTMLADIINREYNIPFIFLTSNADPFTIDKVKTLQPSGFIVKPFDERDLRSAVEIALHKKPVVEEEVIQEKEDKYLFVKNNHKLEKVALNDILYAQAYDNYCFVYTSSQRYLLPSTLKTIEGKLHGKGFIRVHRSYMVNLNRISVIDELHLKVGEHKIPLSKTYKPELIRKISLL